MIARYSASARRQLSEIWQFSRRRWGEARADKYVTTLHEAVQRVAAGKTRPRPCPGIHPDVSLIRSGSHSIYFVVEANVDVLHVVAILHQHMDPRRRVRRALKGE